MARIKPTSGENDLPQMQTVMLLGAPRSGTSMVAGMLDLLGVSMGRIRSPDPLNPTGYFEDTEFLSLADKFLTAAMPGANGFNLPSEDALQQQHGRFDDQIQELVQQRMTECLGKTWGWKAPGTTLFAEEFLSFVTNPRAVVVVRNPANAARSTMKYVRHEIKRKMYEPLNYIDALQTVNRYETSIYNFMSRHPEIPYTAISYEDVTANPTQAIQSLGDLLKIQVNSSTRRRIKSFVSSRRTTAKQNRAARLKAEVRRIPRRILK